MAEQSVGSERKILESSKSAENTSAHRVLPVDDWQASKHQIKEKVAFVFNNKLLSDICFVVGEGTRVQRTPAHKLILSIGSSVFCAMFNGHLADNSDEIEVPDVEPSAFLALLRFLYSDEIRINAEIVLSTLYAAKKYAVPAVEAECVKFLENSLTSDNVFTILMQARFFDERELVEKCLKIIDTSSDAFADENFLELNHNALCSVLNRDLLGVREIELFHAVKRWSVAECKRQKLAVKAGNQRKVLGDALKLIRFPTMSADEFSSHVAQSGLLNEKEVISLFIHLTSKSNKPSIKFISEPRKSSQISIMNRFNGCSGLMGFSLYQYQNHSISFAANRPIFVVGFGIFGCSNLYNRKICIELHDLRKSPKPTRCLGKKETVLQCEEHCDLSIVRVMFEQPIPIDANMYYTAFVKFEFQHCSGDLLAVSGCSGSKKVDVESPLETVTFKICKSSYNSFCTNEQEGQIPQILFSVV